MWRLSDTHTQLISSQWPGSSPLHQLIFLSLVGKQQWEMPFRRDQCNCCNRLRAKCCLAYLAVHSRWLVFNMLGVHVQVHGQEEQHWSSPPESLRSCLLQLASSPQTLKVAHLLSPRGRGYQSSGSAGSSIHSPVSPLRFPDGLISGNWAACMLVRPRQSINSLIHLSVIQKHLLKASCVPPLSPSLLCLVSHSNLSQ